MKPQPYEPNHDSNMQATRFLGKLMTEAEQQEYWQHLSDCVACMEEYYVAILFQENVKAVLKDVFAFSESSRFNG